MVANLQWVFSYFLPFQSCEQFYKGNWVEICFDWVLDSPLKSVFILNANSSGSTMMDQPYQLGSQSTSCANNATWFGKITLLQPTTEQQSE